MRTARPERWILALALACAAADALPADLGTLFNTPEERARLDRLRRGEPLERPAGSSSTAGAREVTGFVKRSDGRSTVWIDGVPMQVSNARAAALLEPKAVRAGESDTIKVERKAPQ